MSRGDAGFAERGIRPGSNRQTGPGCKVGGALGMHYAFWSARAACEAPLSRRIESEPRKRIEQEGTGRTEGKQQDIANRRGTKTTKAKNSNTQRGCTFQLQ